MPFAGPAFCNILNYSIEAECLKKAVLEKRKKGAFGSSAPRLLYLVKREAFTTPGPADYQVSFSVKEYILYRLQCNSAHLHSTMFTGITLLLG